MQTSHSTPLFVASRLFSENCPPLACLTIYFVFFSCTEKIVLLSFSVVKSQGSFLLGWGFFFCKVQFLEHYNMVFLLKFSLKKVCSKVCKKSIKCISKILHLKMHSHNLKTSKKMSHLKFHAKNSIYFGLISLMYLHFCTKM